MFLLGIILMFWIWLVVLKIWCRIFLVMCWFRLLMYSVCLLGLGVVCWVVDVGERILLLMLDSGEVIDVGIGLLLVGIWSGGGWLGVVFWLFLLVLKLGVLVLVCGGGIWVVLVEVLLLVMVSFGEILLLCWVIWICLGDI